MSDNARVLQFPGHTKSEDCSTVLTDIARHAGDSPQDFEQLCVISVDGDGQPRIWTRGMSDAEVAALTKYVHQSYIDSMFGSSEGS